jgi:hypothetical protein
MKYEMLFNRKIKYFERIELEIADDKYRGKTLKFSSSSSVFLSNNVSKLHSS